ncbi:MAG: hypothetical protein HYR58_03065 [Acidobacteria bacterium]|nr:hypothetical protein [Acidobacteriota bacterium]MBI3484521.1 hypothetical protein [Acidobacteriota bacterium]
MSKLEKATYICLIAVSLVSLYLLVENRFSRPAPPGQPSESALVGQREESVPETLWKDSPKNVVLLLNSHCHFCAESTPLYRQLSAMRQRTPHGISLLVASFDSTEKMRDYLVQQNIGVDNVFQASSGFARVSVTPAIFLVDSHGVIRRAFFGKLDWIQERQLLSALNSAGF